MAFYEFPQRFRMRGETAAVLASRNEILLARELCFETDTGLFKIGDGSTAWNDLDYIGGSGGGDANLPAVMARISLRF